MKILSFDVGIKNLAMCLIETNDKNDKNDENDKNDKNDDIKILKWEIINLCNDPKCGVCNKSAKFTKFDKYFCLKHAKNAINSKNIEYDINLKNLEIPDTKELKNIQKMPVKDLRCYVQSLNDTTNNTLLKKDLLKIVEDYHYTKYFDIVKTDNAGQVSLIEIGKILRQRLDEILAIDNNIDKIVIENQLSSIAVRMKTLQGMITQYFIMRDYTNIEYINSSNKLKVASILNFNNDNDNDNDNQEMLNKIEKTTYKQRKMAGVELCLKTLEHYNLTEWTTWFKKSGSKKDDLADCFLQGIYCII